MTVSEASKLETVMEADVTEQKNKSEQEQKVQRDSVVKSSDMSDEMQRLAIQVANEAMDKFRLEKDMATFIKEEFDRRYYPSWHCVVGRNFGSYVTHETNHFIYFYIQHIAFMLFKTGF